jgi:protein phosphatase 2C-like protein
MSVTYCVQKGSVHGVKHLKLGVNNQDAAECQEFGIPKWEKDYRIGFVSDGCTGIPAFSASEVGSKLLVVNCLARTQELIANGARMEEIPLSLYHSVTNFLHTLANMVMPASIHWPYPLQFSGNHEFRNGLKAPQRFMTDYLAATILGFVDDGESLVTFQAGDGVLIINDEVTIIDQNDRPDYPALSVNTPGGGFQVNAYASADVRRLALATD